ncbi:MBL fold metallo-hydrolase [Skermanella stibiiresistens]|uniref:MBL fold metallo-hydrolase n=1 Tax=Skermanella stibiiresistens TaxID=913326 RepID=UPI0004ACC8A2|nr:MBL fold metallo-hydrolase [Skermanella stibiiresistens]
MRFPVTDHCDGERFFNVHDRTDHSFADVLRWLRSRERTPWPDAVVDPPHPPPTAADRETLAVTFIGHSTFLIQVGGMRFLTDPIYAQRASPFSFVGPKRARPPGQPLETLPKVDVTLVSHNHYDHLDPVALREVAARWSSRAVTGLGNAALLDRIGLKDTVELDWWGSVEIGGARITYVPAQHFSARTPFDRNRTLWGGFVIEAGGRTVLFAADSGYCPHFAEIAQRFPRIDLALLPIGAYEPRWFMGVVHMNPEDAVKAHRDLGAHRSVGMHFGTFALTDEGIDAPVTALRRARAAAGLDEGDFTTLEFGETKVFPA